MTNDEWLKQLAQNAPDELAAWFDAEHVENQERALDGDTAALEAEYGKGGVVGGSFYDEAEPGEVVFPFKLITGVANKLNEDLIAERDKLQAQLNRRTVERDNFESVANHAFDKYEKAKAECERYRSKFGKCIDYADAIHALMDEEGMA